MCADAVRVWTVLARPNDGVHGDHLEGHGQAGLLQQAGLHGVHGQLLHGGEHAKLAWLREDAVTALIRTPLDHLWPTRILCTSIASTDFSVEVALSHPKGPSSFAALCVSCAIGGYYDGAYAAVG